MEKMGILKTLSKIDAVPIRTVLWRTGLASGLFVVVWVLAHWPVGHGHHAIAYLIGMGWGGVIAHVIVALSAAAYALGIRLFPPRAKLKERRWAIAAISMTVSLFSSAQVTHSFAIPHVVWASADMLPLMWGVEMASVLWVAMLVLNLALVDLVTSGPVWVARYAVRRDPAQQT